MEENIVIEQTQKPYNLPDTCNKHEKFNKYCRDCDLNRLKKRYYDKGRDLVTCDICKRKVVKYAFNKHLESLVHMKCIFDTIKA